MKSIDGWYGTPAHGANPSFRAPHDFRCRSLRPRAGSATPGRARRPPRTREALLPGAGVTGVSLCVRVVLGEIPDGGRAGHGGRYGRPAGASQEGNGVVALPLRRSTGTSTR